MAVTANTAPALFDRALLCARQARARKQGEATFLLDRVAEDMADRIAAVRRDFSDVADIWTPGEALRAPTAGRFRAIARIGLDPASEAVPLQPESIDLAVSALAFQFVNDLPGVLAQIRRALRPDGLLLAALPGGDTLTELRQSFAAAETECEGGISPRVAPAADLRDFVADRLKSSTNLYAETLEAMERFLFTRVLRETEGNQSRAAEILGITRGKVRDRIAAFGIALDRSVSIDGEERG